MIFLTVGTQFGFDRLVQAVDQCLEQGVIDEEIFAQIGPGRYVPRFMNSTASIERDTFIEMIQSCSGIVSHAGIGSITMALNASRALLVMPRRKKYREHVNDHQLESAMRFERLGHVIVAYEVDEMPVQLTRLKSFVPADRFPNRDGVVERVSEYLSEMLSQPGMR